MRYVGVVGAGVASHEEERIAHAVGGSLASAGYAVVCGGLGGVMEAACRGAKEAGGTTIGVLPGDDRAEANRWVDVVIPSGLGEARNAIVVRTAEAIIAIGGEFGTLSEIALALKLGRPVVGLATWRIEREGMGMDPILRAADPDDAVRLVRERIG
ncbi:MAG: TIGR00725 family protein [Actinomycetota bacterium]